MGGADAVPSRCGQGSRINPASVATLVPIVADRIVIASANSQGVSATRVRMVVRRMGHRALVAAMRREKGAGSVRRAAVPSVSTRSRRVASSV